MRKAILYRNTPEARKAIKEILQPEDLKFQNGEWLVKLRDEYGFPYWEKAEEVLKDDLWKKLPDVECEEKELKNAVLIMLYRARNSDTDWSLAADRFVDWLIQNPDSETFSYFLEVFKGEGEKYLWNEPWDFFFGLEEKDLLNDWIADTDRENFLNYLNADSSNPEP